jgi:dolichol-phosphate mannosyltransferase
MTGEPLFTIVVPMLNEAGNVEPLVREIAAACAPIGPFEVIFVNDGSTDATHLRISALRSEFPWLREIRHARTCGQSAALRSGVMAARAPVICTLDGDGQNPPAANAAPVRTAPRSAWPRASQTSCARASCATAPATPVVG